MTENEITNAIERIYVVCHCLLISIAEKSTSKKDIYLRNAIAKSAMLLKSTHGTFKDNTENNAWILFRAHLDRLVHLLHLEKNQSYSDFNNWTFMNNFEHINNAKADQQIPSVKNDLLFSTTSTDTARYNKLKKTGNTWQKPDPKKILSENGLGFLYKFGYDYASRHTHPSFDDGEYEFFKITGLKSNPYENFINNYSLINSIIVSTMIIQEAMNAHSFKFRSFLYKYLETERNNTKKQVPELNKYFYIIISSTHENIPLFEE